jgi:hypothetical protein
VLTASGVRLLGVHASNDTDAEITFRVTDTAGLAIVPTVVIPARGMFYRDLNFAKFTGLKWQAGAVGIAAKPWGYTV